MGPERKALALAEVGSEISNDSGLIDDLAIRALEQWDEATINIEVPLGLDSKVDFALLEGDIFGFQGEKGPLNEWSEVISVDSEVLSVSLRLRCISRRILYSV